MSKPLYAGKDSVALIDVLDRILDKGVVIVGDITITLVNVELLTIKLKLLICSVDKAKEMGIDFGWAGANSNKLEDLEKRMSKMEGEQSK